MTNSVKTLSVLTFSAVCSILAITVPARSVLAQVSINLTSTPATQSGYNGSQDGGPYPLTATAYDFTGQDYSSLSSLDSLSVTLTAIDADTGRSSTGVRNFDFNDLTLGLDGIDTGVLLNGLPNSQTATTRTFTSVPDNSEALLAALQEDGQLVGSVFDVDNDGGDNIAFPGNFTTTLLLNGTGNDTGGGGTPVPFELSPGLGILALGLWGGMAQLKSKLQKQKSSVSAFSQH